jgi:CRP-like cAMP-binding protein
MDLTSKMGDVPQRVADNALPAPKLNDRVRERWPEIRARSFSSTRNEPVMSHNLLSRDEQRRLHRIATVLDYRRGGITIYSQGEEARSIYLIDEGIIRVSRCAENGQRQILALRVPGDIFGMPDAGRYANSAETVCAAKVFRCPWQRVHQLMLTEPQFQMTLLTKMANELRQAQRRIMMLGQQNVCQRLASFLLDFIALPEFFDERQSILNLPVNRFDLADYLGTAPESTARAFARLESEDLVRRVNSRLVEILDAEGLQNLQCGRRRALRQATQHQAPPIAEELPVPA